MLDFFIKNAQIVDGTGAQPYFGRRSGFWMPTGRRLCRGSLISIAIPTRWCSIPVRIGIGCFRDLRRK